MYKVQTQPAGRSSGCGISPLSNAPAVSGLTQPVRFMNVDVCEKQNLVYFEIEADAFLRGMVRAIVGTFLKLNDKEDGINQLHKILNARDRSAASASAPPHGLSLLRVKYYSEF